MRKRTYGKIHFRVTSLVLALLISPFAVSAPDGSEAMKKEALSAAWPGMVKNATVVDWEGNVLQKGSNGFTCLPTAPTLNGTAPMCMDSEWMKWADAWQNKKEYAPESLGISYM